ncbi:hypothetical protein BDA96_03G353700 [Sorghum bicolor]|uniref:Uncharacterized protein n=2 Tax=Sorghum bicolor TaxID=4558 RepID=A0A921RIN1_SORBI|nr:hypothetical protein BDA96_03G353700 [Sorghum bicolor]OQU87723.1 hypothetical protein SORBI_3003G327950 [Sorghum bicolor]
MHICTSKKAERPRHGPTSRGRAHQTFQPPVRCHPRRPGHRGLQKPERDDTHMQASPPPSKNNESESSNVHPERGRELRKHVVWTTAELVVCWSS